MQRLTVREGKEVFYVKDGQKIPAALLSDFDKNQILIQLEWLERMVEKSLIQAEEAERGMY